MRLFNTASRQVEELVPADGKTFRIYTCGPTVYDFAHIGNFATFVRADFLRRVLELEGFAVEKCSNITDVGHLAGDEEADASGEDKMEKARARTGKTSMEIAKFYTDAFLADEAKLRIISPEHRPRATDAVPGIIELVRILVDRGLAYDAEDAVYFSVATFPDYGKFSGKNLDELRPTERVASTERGKRDPRDFALWKKCVGDNARHELRWESPWGVGFPGWHVECSAMIHDIFGPSGVDIHTGAEDHIFPHHECEVAQWEGAYGTPCARTWWHPRHILVDGKKMSKSLGNFTTLADLEERGFSALDFRFLVLSARWDQQLNFTFTALEAARTARRRIGEALGKIPVGASHGSPGSAMADPYVDSADRNPPGRVQPTPTELQRRFRAALGDNLATPEALAVLHDAIRSGSPEDLAGIAADFAATFDCLSEKTSEIPEDVRLLAEARIRARAARDFAESDRLRDEITRLGWEVRDSASGQELRRA